MNSTKTMLASNGNDSLGKKVLKNLRFHEINDEDLQQKMINLKKQNKTCMVANKLHEENLKSLKKNTNPEKANFIVKKSRIGDKEWKFEPWDDLE